MRWRVHFTGQADADFYDILAYTTETFGERQAETYEATLRAAIRALSEGPETRGSVARDDLSEGMRVLRVARSGKQGRHLIFFRSRATGVIEIVRILHEAMDFARHI